MIVTDRFVWLSHGKTGSTSAEKFCSSLWLNERVNQPKWSRAIERVSTSIGFRHPAYQQILTPSKYPGGVPHKHGSIRDIPHYATQRPIITCFREPFGYFLSHYKYGAWRRQNRLVLTPDAEYSETLIAENSIESFIEYLNLQARHRLLQEDLSSGIGILTIDIADQFSLDPSTLLQLLAVRHVRLAEAFPAVTFFRTENLLVELSDYLEQIKFCVGYIPDVMPNTHENKSRNIHLTQEDKALILEYLKSRESTIYSWSDELNCASADH